MTPRKGRQTMRLRPLDMPMAESLEEFQRFTVLCAIREQLWSTRRHDGLSQERVALDSGIALSTYRRFEDPSSGAKLLNPRLSTLIRVSNVLNLHERWFPCLRSTGSDG